jgi:surface carbohydrate biosynthesis protein
MKIPVYIGHKADIFKLASDAEHPGILFNKSVGYKNNRELYKSLWDKGFRIAAQDEESGIVFSNYRDFYERRPSLNDIGILDKWFCWGKDEFDFLKNNLEIPEEKLEISGSPRTILWRRDFAEIFWKPEITLMTEKVTDYILIVTNSVLKNSFLTDKMLVENFKNELSQQSTRQKIFYEKLKFESESDELLIKLIQGILKNSSYNIVLKTHPAENPKPWHDIFRFEKRVRIISTGPVSPWILSARAVLHNGSTSALEAFSFGKPIICYLTPERRVRPYSKDVPIALSHCIVQNEYELLEFLGKFDYKPYNWEKSHILETKISYLDSTSSLDIISRCVSDLSPFDGNYNLLEKFERQSSLSKIKAFLSQTRLFLPQKQIIMNRYKRPKVGSEYITEIIKRASSFAEPENEYKIERIRKNVFKIY